jgi:hypothetical protein
MNETYQDLEQHDSIVRAVQRDLSERSERGMKKYGTTLDRTDVELKGWIQHAYEEVLDLALYLKRIKRDLG